MQVLRHLLPSSMLAMYVCTYVRKEEKVSSVMVKIQNVRYWMDISRCVQSQCGGVHSPSISQDTSSLVSVEARMGKHIPRIKGQRQTKRATPKKIAKAQAALSKEKGRGKGSKGKASSKSSSHVLGEADGTVERRKSRPGKEERANPDGNTRVARGSIKSISHAKSLLTEGGVPKTKKGQRIMKARAPQLVENDKKILVVKGSKTSQIINDALKDITALTKPLSKAYTRNNDLLPFEVSNSATRRFLLHSSIEYIIHLFHILLQYSYSMSEYP